MLLAIILAFRTCDYKHETLGHYRCLITRNTHTWEFTNQTGQIAFLLHGNSKSKVIFYNATKSGNDNVNYSLGPGSMVSFMDNNVTASCTGDDCEMTVWHTSYDKDDGFFISDAAGVLYKGTGITIDSRYPSFFDFGDTVRVQKDICTHPRSTGVYIDGPITNSSLVEEKIIVSSVTNFSVVGPGILHISSSPFIGFDLSLIIGSQVLLPSEFSSTASSGKVVSIENFTIKSHSDPPSALSTFVAAQQEAWKVMQYVMMSITIAICLTSLVMITLKLVRAFCASNTLD